MVSVVAILACVLTVEVASQASTIPSPKGVVLGTQQFTHFCDDTGCTARRVIRHATIVGQLKGVGVVASASPIIYDAFHSSTCPFGCEPSPPKLAQPFTIVGTTGAGEAFEATCTSGSLRSLVTNANVLRIVDTNCNGGPASSPGPMAFRFLIPTEDPLVFTEWGFAYNLVPPLPMAAVLVGA